MEEIARTDIEKFLNKMQKAKNLEELDLAANRLNQAAYYYWSELQKKLIQ